jgi:hypothetical protein
MLTGVRRCSICNVNYPADQAAVCPICEHPTAYHLGLSVTPGWEDIAADGIEARELAAKDAELFQTLNVLPETRGDSIVIDSHELIRSGIQRRLQPGEIFRIEIGDQSFYVEILDYSYVDRLYLVREFDIAAPDYVPKEWLKPRRRKKKKKEEKS